MFVAVGAASTEIIRARVIRVVWGYVFVKRCRPRVQLADTGLGEV